MAERVRVRERAATLGDGYQIRAYEAHVKEHLERARQGSIVVRADDRDWELCRQGRIKWYLHANVDDGAALGEWWVFAHDIRIHSGSHRHQGGLIIYVVEGAGYTEVEGVREEWEAGDLLLLPLRPGGVEHQHFNANPGTPCKWVAFIYTPLWDALATDDVQLKNSPEWHA